MDGITLIIPTRGLIQTWPLLIQSIMNQKVSFPVEILLIQNDVQDDSQKIKAFHFKNTNQADLQFFYLKEAGVNFSRNLGIQKATHQLVFFLDDDCELSDELILQKHFRIHQQKLNLFALGGLYQISDKASYFSKLYQKIQMRWLFKGLLNETESRYLIGGHFSAKKDLLLQNEIYFNEGIQYGGSELAFFEKAFARELKMELGHLSVLHHTNESLTSLTRKLFKQGCGLAYLNKRNPQQELAKDLNQDDLTENFFLSFLNLVFWFGYFNQKKNRWGYFVFLIKLMKSFFIGQRGPAAAAVECILDVLLINYLKVIHFPR
jgi:glycosyltransferase involved in cell wall biosynthesis